MKTFRAHLKSASPIQFSRNIDDIPSLEKESPTDKDARVWKEKAHYDKNGFVTIPPNFFSNSIAEAAKYLSIKIVGEGQAKYTKNFRAGVMVVEGIATKYTRENVEFIKVFGNALGKRGGDGARVWKKFPVVPEWEGYIEYIIVDEKITKDIFSKVLDSCGKLQGLGTFRPINGGYFGRFEVLSIEEI